MRPRSSDACLWEVITRGECPRQGVDDNGDRLALLDGVLSAQLHAASARTATLAAASRLRAWPALVQRGEQRLQLRLHERDASR